MSKGRTDREILEKVAVFKSEQKNLDKGGMRQMRDMVLLAMKEARADERKALTAKVEELEKEVKGIGKSYRYLQNKCESQRAHIEELKDMIADYKEDHSNAEDRINGYEKALRDFKAEKENLLDCARGKHYWLRMDKIIICKWCLIEEYQTPVAAIRDGVEKLRYRGMWGAEEELLDEVLVLLKAKEGKT